MAGDDPDEKAGEQWIFTESALAQAREAARERAVQALQAASAEGGERRAGSREPPKPLGLEEGLRLALFYAPKVSELCDLCDAPADVRWTAVVFYRRFFVVRSPMEYDPLPLMFACVHVACKVEEVHEITLERLLEAADFGADEALKARVLRSELPLLEALSFELLVEPKPHAALRMLAEELRARGARQPAAQPPALAALGEEGWREALQRAETLTLELAVRSDALLRWPASVAIAAALGSALDHRAGGHCGEGGAVGTPASQAVLGLLQESLEVELQRRSVGGMFDAVIRCAAGLGSQQEITEEAVKEAAKGARRCHRAFEKLRELATESNEAQRKDRKRKCSEMKGAGTSQRQVPAPLLCDLMDLNRKFQTSAGCAALSSGTLEDAAQDAAND